jgi:hypothetical protein
MKNDPRIHASRWQEFLNRQWPGYARQTALQRSRNRTGYSYSLHNENCIDLVLFLNGLPVATVELKTDFTQSVEDAVGRTTLSIRVRSREVDRNVSPVGPTTSMTPAFPVFLPLRNVIVVELV